MGIGDELMAAGRAHKISKANGGSKVRITDPAGNIRWVDIWERTPWVAKSNAQASLAITDAGGARPYIASKTPKRWIWQPYSPSPAPFILSDDELNWARQFSGRIVLSPHIKPKASPNKQWPWANWQKLARRLNENKLRAIQIRESDKYPLLDNADSVTPPTFWHAATLLKVAGSAILHEGGLHHASAGVNGKAIVIAGGYIGRAQTGYCDAQHIWLGTENAGCGLRVYCQHCSDEMKKITPDIVLEQTIGLLNEQS